MLGIPPLKSLEGIVNVKLEPFSVENEAPNTKILTPKLLRTPNTTVKLPDGTSHAIEQFTEKHRGNLEMMVDHQKVPAKLEDSLDANVGEYEFGSTLEDFVSKALDSFLDIQEKIKVLESVPVEDQTQEHIHNLLCLKNELQNKKKRYLGFVNPEKDTQHMELPKAKYCTAFDEDGISNNRSSASTKNMEEREPMKEKPIQKQKLALKECNLCAMKFLNDRSLLMHNRAKKK